MKRRTVKKQCHRSIAEGRRWFKRYRGLHNYWWLQLYGMKIGRLMDCRFYTSLEDMGGVMKLPRISFERASEEALLPKRAGQCRCPQCLNDATSAEGLCNLHQQMVDNARQEANDHEDMVEMGFQGHVKEPP